MNDATPAAPRLELRGITKRFPGVLANDRVSFAVAHGEIHALLGENGAGKSTLVKIIYGVLHADEGAMLWQGEPVRVADPHAARGLGIGMVFQHFSLFEAMTVLENIALGVDDAGDMRTLSRRIVEVSHAYGLPLDPAREVHTLSVGERQRIEIVRCLLQNPKLLIMDEPTSVLTPQEVERLFETLRQLAAEGCSILYISHKLHEIKALCDCATILRGGKVVATCDPKAETAKSMAQLMIGSEVRTVARRAGEARGEPRLVVRNLDLPADGPFGTTLKALSFEVRRGEIFGIAGVAGNGQNELFQALSGERLVAGADMVQLDDRRVGRIGAGGRRGLGLCCVPEERNGHAAVPDMSLAENALLSGRQRKRLSASGFIRAGCGATLCRGGDQRLRRQDARRVGRSPLALGRQPAEIHRRPRGAAGPGHPGGLAADLGGRCRRRGRYPRSSAQPRERRGRGARDLAGPRRAAHAHRPPGRDQRRRAVRHAGHGRGLARRDRPADGRAARHGRARARPRGRCCPCRLRSRRGRRSAGASCI